MNKFDIINYNDRERSVHLPNEIFFDLSNNIASTRHVAFAFTYLYMVTYLYLYLKYTSCHTEFTQSQIKDYLGYNANNKTIDYIIKKGGLLDSIGYTETTTDFPISFEMFEKKPYFRTANDNPNVQFPWGNNFKIKYPVKAFYRNNIARNNKYMNGTIYDATNTTGILTSTFIRAMQDVEVGTVGFYVYAYIKCNADVKGGMWAISQDDMAYDLKISKATLIKFIRILEQNSFIAVTHMPFFDNPVQFANEYRVIAK